MRLFTYWRSQAAFRVRIALRLKNLPIEKISLDLLKGDQFDASYQALNPEGVVPTLIDGGGQPLVQSLAILEYLDEKYPDPPFLPKDLRARAHARAKWVRHWLDAGSRAVEEVLARDPRTGKFCVGDQVTVADICLAAHLTSAKLFGGREPSEFRRAGRIYAECMAIEAFAAEHPLRQPDAPPA